MEGVVMDWSDCDLVESVPGKVSGVPVLIGTRLPVEAITGNFDAFLEEGFTDSQALVETLECYPSAGLERIKSVLEYRANHEHELPS